MNYFIKQFAEEGSANFKCDSVALGTGTDTKSIEGSDQDNNTAIFSANMGTKTFTASVEETDQDPHGGWLMGNGATSSGTGTATESIESLDQDRANNFFEA